MAPDRDSLLLGLLLLVAGLAMTIGYGASSLSDHHAILHSVGFDLGVLAVVLGVVVVRRQH